MLIPPYDFVRLRLSPRGFSHLTSVMQRGKNPARAAIFLLTTKNGYFGLKKSPLCYY